MRAQRCLVIALLATIATACAPTMETAGPPWCDDFGVLMLEAQSVPSAQLLPCVDLMPIGWSVGGTHANDEGASFVLESSVAGPDAARVRLTDRCDTKGYIQVPTDEPDTLRYEYITQIIDGFQSRRIYEFEGGCAEIAFSFDVEVSAALVNEVSLALSFVHRDAVNEAVRTATDGREQLDPLPFTGDASG